MIKRRFGASLRALSASTALIIITTVFACIFGTGPFSNAWAKPKGLLQIGFTGTIAASAGTPQRFKNLYLNVQEVRVNANPNAGPNGGGWQDIVVPQGVAQQGAGKPADLQVDLNNLQNLPVLFNAGQIRRNTYKLVEVLLDTKHPGEIVPLCPPAGAGGLEGCAPYPITLQNTSGQISSIDPSVSVGHFTMSTLLINLNVTVISAPSSPGSNYVVNLVVSSAPVQTGMGLISGNIAGTSGITPNVRRVRTLAVTAEQAGTNIQVSSSPVVNGNFQIQLPAAANTGTLYDLFTSGGGTSYSAERLAPLFPGANTIPNFIINTGLQLGTISGNVTDICTKAPIPNATVQLLIAPQGSNVNCAAAPGQCVSVATASTDNTGHFPLTGQVKVPATFNNIPLPPANSTYTLEISAPGYDTMFTTGTPTVPPVHKTVLNGGTCGSANGACNFALTSGQIEGMVNLTAAPPSGQTVLVQVFAEKAGTNDVVAALPRPLIFRNQTQSLSFDLNVPSGPAAFDFYASAIDLYTNITDPYTGHTILAQPNVPGFNGTPSCTPTKPAGAIPFEQNMECTGHGSLAGTFINPTANTTAVLMKDGVQIMNSGVGPILPLGTNPANPTFAFCAPGDTYSIQRLDVTNPPAGTVPVETPTPQPVGTPTMTTIPLASPTSTPCPTTCSSNGACPGVCNGVVANPL